jgi:ribosomal protein S18 acetylase RimI-like enzyme
MKKQINETDLLRLADLNLAEFWCELARCIPGSEILQKNDIVLIDSALSFPGASFAFNLSLEAEANPDEFISEAIAFFLDRKPAFSLQLRGHLDQSIIEYCEKYKMFFVAQSPGMVIEEPIKPDKIPDGAELHWINDAKGVEDFGKVVAEAYVDLSFPKEVSESYFANPKRVISPQFELAVAYLEGEPASTALVLFSHGIAGIYWVGTIKKARGRGLAEYCTREVSNAAFDLGARTVVLQASKFGRPVYERMGFREFTSYPWFICPSKIGN